MSTPMPHAIQPFAFQTFSDRTVNLDRLKEPTAPAVQAEEPASAPIEENVLPPEPVFTAAELETAQKKGHDAGFNEGFTLAQNQARTEAVEREESIRALLARIAEETAALPARYQSFLEQSSQKIGTLALAIARQVAGDALKQDPSAEIMRMATELLAAELGTARVVITVSNQVVVELRRRLEAWQETQDSPLEIVLTGDAAMEAGDCRIDWGEGVAERSADSIWKEMTRLVSASSQGANKAASTHDSPIGE